MAPPPESQVALISILTQLKVMEGISGLVHTFYRRTFFFYALFSPYTARFLVGQNQNFRKTLSRVEILRKYCFRVLVRFFFWLVLLVLRHLFCAMFVYASLSPRSNSR